jgi:hypothetical protein
LLEDLVCRRYYKRVTEFALADLKEPNWIALRDIFNGPGRRDVQRRVEDALLRSLRSAIQDQMRERQSLVRDRTLERLDEIAKVKHSFLVDLPLRGASPSGEDPLFVSDYKRRHFRTTAGVQESAEAKPLWSEYVGPLMRRIAFFRVFCEPEIHTILKRVLRLSDVMTVLRAEIKQLA